MKQIRLEKINNVKIKIQIKNGGKNRDLSLK